jgi:23S rRNA (guanosine2251-2'-O)-methyltransferase
MRNLVLIAHNIRSCHNVGSLLRTAEGLGAEVILSGYTPYPKSDNDSRLPHEIQKISKQIHKTALGAEESVVWKRTDDIFQSLKYFRSRNYMISALEHADDSIPLPEFAPPDKLVIIVGREVEGIEPDVLTVCDVTIEIPMSGKKESFNVVQAAAMALYHARFA